MLFVFFPNIILKLLLFKLKKTLSLFEERIKAKLQETEVSELNSLALST